MSVSKVILVCLLIGAVLTLKSVDKLQRRAYHKGESAIPGVRVDNQDFVYSKPFLLKCYNGASLFDQKSCNDASACNSMIQSFKQCQGRVSLTYQGQNNQRQVQYAGVNPSPNPNNPTPNNPTPNNPTPNNPSSNIPVAVDGVQYQYSQPFILKCYNGNTVFKTSPPCYDANACVNNLRDFSQCTGRVTLIFQNQNNERIVAYRTGGPIPNVNPIPNVGPTPNVTPFSVDGAPYSYQRPFLLKCYNGNNVFKQSTCEDAQACSGIVNDFKQCQGRVSLTYKFETNERQCAYAPPNNNGGTGGNGTGGAGNAGIQINGQSYVYTGPFSLRCYDSNNNVLRESPPCQGQAACAALLQQYRTCPGRVTKLTPA